MPKKISFVTVAVAIAVLLFIAINAINSDNTEVADSIATSTAATDSSTSQSPPTTDSPLLAEQSIDVAQVIMTVEAQTKVVATLGVGSGPGEVSFEECDDCEPLLPWAPVRLNDGRIILADGVNHRWVLLNDGESSEFVWPGSVVASAQPVIDDADRVYVIMQGPLGKGGETQAELWVYEATNFAEPILRNPASTIFGSTIDLSLEGVSINGVLIDGLTPQIKDRPQVEFVSFDTSDPDDSTRVKVIWPGHTTNTFIYGEGESPELFGPMPDLEQGDVFMQLLIDGQYFVDRLSVDGTVTRMAVAPNGSISGAAWADPTGFLQLELDVPSTRWQIVHYDLPDLM
jgi:hypothetical protein